MHRGAGNVRRILQMSRRRCASIWPWDCTANNEQRDWPRGVSNAFSRSSSGAHRATLAHSTSTSLPPISTKHTRAAYLLAVALARRGEGRKLTLLGMTPLRVATFVEHPLTTPGTRQNEQRAFLRQASGRICRCGGDAIERMKPIEGS